MTWRADIDVAKREPHLGAHPVQARIRDTRRQGAFPDARDAGDERGLPAVERPQRGQFNTIFYERTDSYRDNAARDAVLMNAADMAGFGVADGERIALVTDHGRLEGTVRAYDVACGGILAYFPEANVLIGTEVDPRSKTPAFKSTPVRVERVGG